MSRFPLVPITALLVLGLALAGVYLHRRRNPGEPLSGADSRAAMLDVAIDWLERVLIVALAISFAYAAWRTTHHWNRLMIIPEAITVLFVLFRRTAISVNTYPLDWGLGVVGTGLTPLK